MTDHIRKTEHGLLTGVYKTPQGKWMMTVRTKDGSYVDVPHDGVVTPPTMNTKPKRK